VSAYLRVDSFLVWLARALLQRWRRAAHGYPSGLYSSKSPKSIAVIAEHPDFDETLRASPIPAAIGSLPLVILALGRKRPLVGFVLLLSILLASLTVFMTETNIGFENTHMYVPDVWFIAYGRLEEFLGFTLPAIIYSFLFCGAAFYLLRWLVLRLKAIRSGPSPDQPP